MRDSHIQLGREALRQFNRRIGVLKTDPYQLGLSLSQGSALVEIAKVEGLRPQALARLLNLEKSSVSRLVSNLAERHLVKIQDDPEDGRGKMLRLTPKGADAVRKINAVADGAVAEIFHHLKAEEREQVAAAFQLMMNSLSLAAALSKA